MSTPFENATAELKSFIPYDNKGLREKFEQMTEEIKQLNKNNIGLFIKVGNIEETEIYIGDMSCFEDYEILTGSRKDEDGNEFSTKEEYEKHLEEKKKEEFELWTIKTIYIVDGDEYDTEKEARENMSENDELELRFEIYDDEIFEDEFDSLEDAEQYIEDEKENWTEDQPEFEDLDKEYDEIYWNYAWRYWNDDIDVELAEQLGLVVINVTEEADNVEGGTYLTLGGCGMDLSPNLVAYQALEYGYIDSKYIGKLDSKNSREYFKYVVGGENYRKVIERLGITELIKED